MNILRKVFKNKKKEEQTHLIIKNGKNDVRKYPKKTLLAQSLKLEK